MRPKAWHRHEAQFLGEGLAARQRPLEEAERPAQSLGVLAREWHHDEHGGCDRPALRTGLVQEQDGEGVDSQDTMAFTALTGVPMTSFPVGARSRGLRSADGAS